MRAPPTPLATRGTGFGLGLRTPHYPDFLAGQQPLDWLEIITDNFLVQGGKPLVMLDTFRRDYPMALHGVAMSIGAPGGLDLAYLQQVKALTQRIEPLWVSDHLCWIGHGPEQLHDLCPLPYTDEAARHVATHIRQAQDVLGRRLVLENVSSYTAFTHDTASEWQFLAHIAEAADCLLLLDVNNVYVSSVNHGYDPLTYLRALPAHRVQQIHLAGHSHHGRHAVDTHDQPVCPAVWALYAEACRLFGAVATMVERDAHIPPLTELLAEVAVARAVANDPANAVGAAAAAPNPVVFSAPTAPPGAPALLTVQREWADHVLDRSPGVPHWVAGSRDFSAAQRMGVYHHAYRARLSEVLADSYPHTRRYLGDDTFEAVASGFAVAHPPTQRNLGAYGAGWVQWLAKVHPLNPELHELAQLEWDLRACFDGPDAPALDALAAERSQGQWLQTPSPLHPSVVVRRITTNAVALWHALADDEPVPAPQRLPESGGLVVWRKGLQPHFQTLGASALGFWEALAKGHSMAGACDALACAATHGSGPEGKPSELAQWMRTGLDNGWLRVQ
jgi:uncharacterized protein (UPF0276 family)